MEPAGSGHDDGVVNGSTRTIRRDENLIVVAVDFLPAMALGNRKQNYIIFLFILLRQYILLCDLVSRSRQGLKKYSNLLHTAYLMCIVDKGSKASATGGHAISTHPRSQHHIFYWARCIQDSIISIHIN
jgi:hypothetical protein